MPSLVERRHGGSRKGAMAAGLAALAALAAVPTTAQVPAGMKTFENAQFRYSVALPVGCRHDEGPGTVDAVCSTDLDPNLSAVANSASALVLEVGAEAAADGAGRTPSELAQRYGEVTFKEELPEAVCGEADKGRVKIDNVKQALDDAQVVYTADVVCAEVKFLQIGERRASVRFLIGPEARYRLVARAPTDEYEKQKATIEAFFTSFRVTPGGRANP